MSRRVHLAIETTETVGVPGVEMPCRYPACCRDAVQLEPWTDDPAEVWCKGCRQWMKENLVTETTRSADKEGDK